MDPRIEEHAKVLVNWSTEIKRGDMVAILTSAQCNELTLALVKEVAKAGGRPFAVLWNHETSRAFFDGADDETIELFPKQILAMVENIDAVIVIGAPENTKILAGVNPKKLMLDAKTMKPIMDVYVTKRWVGTIHPTNAFAQQANMSLEEYQEFAYDAMLIDWENSDLRNKRVSDSLVQKQISLRQQREDSGKQVMGNIISPVVRFSHHL